MIRRIYKIEFAPDEFLDLPPYRYASETSQGLRAARADMVGADYTYRLLGRQVSPLMDRRERIHFLAVGEPAEVNRDYDDLKARLHYGAVVKLWSRGAEFDEHGDAVVTERWTEGELESMPEMRLDVRNRRHAPITLVFNCADDWHGDPYAGDPIALAGDSSFSIMVGGNAQVRDAIITLSDEFAAPVITNTTTGYRLASQLFGAAGFSKLRWDSGRRVFEASGDGGATWIDAYRIGFVRQPNQVEFMRLAPGLNEFEVTGVPDASIEFEFSDKWH